MGIGAGWNRLAVLLVLAAACAVPAGAAEPLPSTAVDMIRLEDTLHKKRTRGIVESASRKLGGRFCEAVVDDFKTLQGRPLRTTLVDRNLTAGEALRAIFFRDGGSHGACKRGALAYTSVGNSNVFLCGSFHEAAVHQPALAEVIVIHELLHVLGLGENPPTSVAITKQVALRCAR